MALAIGPFLYQQEIDMLILFKRETKYRDTPFHVGVYDLPSENGFAARWLSRGCEALKEIGDHVLNVNKWSIQPTEKSAEEVEAEANASAEREAAEEAEALAKKEAEDLADVNDLQDFVEVDTEIAPVVEASEEIVAKEAKLVETKAKSVRKKKATKKVSKKATK